MLGTTNGDVVLVEPEVDLVAWFDPEPVPKLFGDDDLALRPDTVSHTAQYNRTVLLCRAPGQVPSQTVSPPSPSREPTDARRGTACRPCERRDIRP